MTLNNSSLKLKHPETLYSLSLLVICYILRLIYKSTHIKFRYNRTSSLKQDGERFKLEKSLNNLTIFNQEVSLKVPFSDREKENQLISLFSQGKVSKVIVENLSWLRINTIDTLFTLKFLDENGFNMVVRGVGNVQFGIDKILISFYNNIILVATNQTTTQKHFFNPNYKSVF